ncbi:metallophosphoesterase family protein [Kutzneria kofuensis]|uniref:Icc-related predicted phosphoesterase n=1 Tax=Kutzneria kofuensis TaxID=103725 RepID=A0A7W9NJP6_9PSEU|nr:metallophosphoesterase [Kutzneria kofuensis]MBB5895160.1 Icc-related predicted phosphoesterase [Kutzneria kofuensis]
MIRVAAVGDVHLGVDTKGTLRPAYEGIAEHADLVLLAGDLTRLGTVAEGEVVADEFAGLDVPVVAVLGNHDHQSDAEEKIAGLLVDRGITVLEGSGTVLDVDGVRVGIAGAKGFGGGFAGKCGHAFGEREMKAFIHHTEDVAEQLRTALLGLTADVRISLTHYSPSADTLRGEPPEIFPFLGSYLLAEAIDDSNVDLALHGHAHYGSEAGTTAGGVRVRNVAQPVIQAAYRVYTLEPASVVPE